MKRLLTILYSIVAALSCLAQNETAPIVPLTERIFLTTEQNACALGCVLNVRGTVLSTDYSDFYPYSRYVNLELIGNVTDSKGTVCPDSVIVRQKVRCDERGYFFATVPTDACPEEGRYYLRAYTRFMRNRPVETFPMTSVLLTYYGRREDNHGGTCIVSLYPEGGQLMAGPQQQLVAYVTDSFGHPLGGVQLAVVAGADTLATATTRPSGYASLSLMDNALTPSAEAYVSIRNGAQEMHTELPEITSRSPFIRTFRTGKKLRVQLSEPPVEGSHLYGFQSGFGLKEFPLPTATTSLTLDTSEMPEGLFTFWLTAETPDGAAPEVLSERSIWVGNVPSGQHVQKITEGTLIRHIVSDNHPTPRAFEMLHLYNVRSAVPFPTTFYGETEREARTDLDLWLTTASFVGFSIADALAARFDYLYAPEQALTITGTALTPDGRPLRAGSVELLNLETMDNHICTIAEDGSYSQTVADFADGDRFFIESVDTQNKNHRYGVTLEETRPATMFNWLRIADEANAHTGSLAHTVNSSIAGGVDLNEAVVTGRSNNRPDWRASQMEGIYVFSHETLQRPIFTDLESVLIRSGWVDISYADTSNPAPDYMKGLREANRSMAAGNDWGAKADINKVCIYRSGRTKNQSLQQRGRVWMNFLLDDILYTHNFEDILMMPIDGIESIEIVKPSLADSRLIRNNSMNGLIIVKSRHLMKSKDIPSAGITVRPAGLTLPSAPDTPTQFHPAPWERTALELITPDRQIISWEE